MFKDIVRVVVLSSVYALTVCKVTDLYNDYAHNEVAKARLKKNIKNLNPFRKDKESE